MHILHERQPAKNREEVLSKTSFPRGTLGAIIWDYDGTLVDTRKKNLSVTRNMVEQIAGIDPSTFPALQSLETYAKAQACSANWRDFYEREFGFDHELIDESGKAWSKFQLDDRTPIQVFDGIHCALHQLRHLRHGIVSQNSRSAIALVLDENDLRRYFRFIVGYEEVDLHLQKPAPDGLLQCIDRVMKASSGLVLYVGDHETDAACARNANEVLRRTGRQIHVASVGVRYSQSGNMSDWAVQPDFQAGTVQDIVVIVESLSTAADGFESSAGNPIP